MNTLLMVNALYFLFGATMYMGTMCCVSSCIPPGAR